MPPNMPNQSLTARCTPIQRLAALAAATQAHAEVVNAIDDADSTAAADPDEIEVATLVDTLQEIDRTIMRLPAACRDDLMAKLIVWQEFIADPGRIYEEEHVPLFAVLQADVVRLTAP